MSLERYLTLVGIIASITPLMGILGTVFGMIDVFSTLVSAGQGDAKSVWLVAFQLRW